MTENGQKDVKQCDQYLVGTQTHLMTIPSTKLYRDTHKRYCQFSFLNFHIYINTFFEYYSRTTFLSELTTCQRPLG